MPKTLATRLADLERANTADLRARWEDAYECPAPTRASHDFLLRALAYRVQEQAEGGLSKAARKQLAILADPGANAGRPLKPRLNSGTRLVRTWRGTVHQVTVIDDGFEYRGDRYGNLSQIARMITGTRWSGPLFFGLRKAGTGASAATNAH